MSLSLFRKEALDHQRHRLWGEVILVQPVHYPIIITLILAIIVAALIFLTSQTYARKESVSGFLTPAEGLSQIYAREGGTVIDVFVATGQLVKKGDPLASIQLERYLLSGQGAQRGIRRSIERELEGLQRRIKRLPAKHADEAQMLRQRISGVKRELAAIEAQKPLIDEQLAVAREQHAVIVDLAKRGYAPRRVVGERRDSVLRIEQTAGSLKQQHIATMNSLESAKADLSQLGYQMEDEKASLQSRLEVLQQQLLQLDGQVGYQIVSPKDGIISGLHISKGAVLNPQRPVAAVSPEHSTLKARLLVPSRSAGLIGEGMDVRLQYDAFPYQRFGIYTGKVDQVSGSILAPTEVASPVAVEESVYLVDVLLERQTIVASGRDVLLKPGMSLTADVTLEHRTLIEWLLDPVLSLKGKI